MSPARRREAVNHVQKTCEVSQRRACRILDQPLSTQRYQPSVKEDERALLSRILELVAEFPRFGYRQITRLLQSEGWQVNAKRVYRLWRQEGLKVPKKVVNDDGLAPPRAESFAAERNTKIMFGLLISSSTARIS